MSEQKASKIREIISAIQEHERFMIATHVHPDGDALGALLGVKLILERLGKKADIFAQDGCPPEFEFLPHAREIRSIPPRCRPGWRCIGVFPRNPGAMTALCCRIC